MTREVRRKAAIWNLRYQPHELPPARSNTADCLDCGLTAYGTQLQPQTGDRA